MRSQSYVSLNIFQKYKQSDVNILFFYNQLKIFDEICTYIIENSVIMILLFSALVLTLAAINTPRIIDNI